jgi:hypothetical protein
MFSREAQACYLYYITSWQPKLNTTRFPLQILSWVLKFRVQSLKYYAGKGLGLHVRLETKRRKLRSGLGG